MATGHQATEHIMGQQRNKRIAKDPRESQVKTIKTITAIHLGSLQLHFVWFWSVLLVNITQSTASMFLHGVCPAFLGLLWFGKAYYSLHYYCTSAERSACYAWLLATTNAVGQEARGPVGINLTRLLSLSKSSLMYKDGASSKQHVSASLTRFVFLSPPYLMVTGLLFWLGIQNTNLNAYWSGTHKFTTMTVGNGQSKLIKKGIAWSAYK